MSKPHKPVSHTHSYSNLASSTPPLLNRIFLSPYNLSKIFLHMLFFAIRSQSGESFHPSPTPQLKGMLGNQHFYIYSERGSQVRQLKGMKIFTTVIFLFLFMLFHIPYFI